MLLNVSLAGDIERHEVLRSLSRMHNRVTTYVHDEVRMTGKIALKTDEM